jgi:hypothetical protein
MLKQRILNTIASHPRLVTLGIGFAITLAVGTVLGMTDGYSHTAWATPTDHRGHFGGGEVCVDNDLKGSVCVAHSP